MEKLGGGIENPRKGEEQCGGWEPLGKMKILMEDKEHLGRIESWRGWRDLGRMESLGEDEEDGEPWER